MLQNIVSEPDFTDSFLEDLKDFVVSQRGSVFAFLDKVVDVCLISFAPPSAFINLFRILTSWTIVLKVYLCVISL